MLRVCEQTAEFYRSHYGRQHFPHLVAHVSGGPLVAMVLAGTDAIERWRTLMGPARVEEAQAYWPDTLRARYGRRTEFGDYFNGLHGSENYAEAVREIHFFFPNMLVGPVPRLWQIRDYIQKNLRASLAPALTQLAHEKPAEPMLWLADRLRRHNPNEPEFAPQPAEMAEEMKCYTPNPSQASNLN
ncbi:Nucleoside diphosphate kinase homolog 5 [Eumeta japonica]|uniref:Nucleoside diphosphate kinase homolog 5 n=1 Tax=Eumeta variegata TaxID=151549 RepID=A0A4C1TWQ6_EUMVA|nr:Nucleoside diphosphate kinase homolog 5 [Eumeta japonica]